MREPAFALVVVLVLTSVIMLATLACWHRTALFIDLVMQHEQYQKKVYKAEVVLNAGLALIKKHHGYFFQKNSKKKMPLEFSVMSDIFEKNSATVIVSCVTPEKLWCKATVRFKNKHGMQIDCSVKRHILEQKEANETLHYSFVIDYVTFSALA